MKSRPILFSGAMVRALLNGSKTQTRRLVKWSGVDAGLNLNFTGLRAGVAPNGWVLSAPTRTSSEWRCKPTPCPYGNPGDRLWVRETLALYGHNAMPLGPMPQQNELRQLVWGYAADGSKNSTRRVPAIHMPRWASRITLEITEVRVERLQHISEADAAAEGVEMLRVDAGPLWLDYLSSKWGERNYTTTSPKTSYRTLWEKLNGDGSWDANPWVWSLTFKRTL